MWQDWYQSSQRRKSESSSKSAGKSAIYDQLKKRPVFKEMIKYIILRKPLVEEIRQLITPAEKVAFIPLLSESMELERQV
jgi:hypothetical protein